MHLQQIGLPDRPQLPYLFFYESLKDNNYKIKNAQNSYNAIPTGKIQEHEDYQLYKGMI